jgi:hypothetical protein
MGTTPTYQLPYPEATDPADVPLDMRELADRIEAAIGNPFDTRLDALEARPTSALVKIAELDLAAVKDFTNIPQTYAGLRLVARVRTAAGITNEFLYVRFNDVADANYDQGGFAVINAAFTSRQQLAQNQLLVGRAPGASALGSWFGSLDLSIPGYRDTNTKVVLGQSYAQSGSSLAEMIAESVYGFWRYGNAITKISFLQTFAAGSRAWLYGIS